ncbi:hypothetical protein SEA_SATIS_214 [Streptomyces phage Satis]|nr:hypothetical protein SEA_SATIS_214 [Streptomyces phage Satis]QBZ72102.1 hypothetical protein SEA_KRADAL_216 [Streptomyces phage Kradal]QPL14522.1 hypothetical protein SEA_EHYELIMAYOE_217 [Streptomyces phage EhyElimayoE]
MSETISMVRLLHGLMYPTSGRCANSGCYLGRNLAGVRLETGSLMQFPVMDSDDHARKAKLDLTVQRDALMELLRADGANVVRIDARGVLVVSRRGEA